jgi:hypothetical protein
VSEGLDLGKVASGDLDFTRPPIIAGWGAARSQPPTAAAAHRCHSILVK